MCSSESSLGRHHGAMHTLLPNLRNGSHRGFGIRPPYCPRFADARNKKQSGEFFLSQLSAFPTSRLPTLPSTLFALQPSHGRLHKHLVTFARESLSPYKMRLSTSALTTDLESFFLLLSSLKLSFTYMHYNPQMTVSAAGELWFSPPRPKDAFYDLQISLGLMPMVEELPDSDTTTCATLEVSSFPEPVAASPEPLPVAATTVPPVLPIPPTAAVIFVRPVLSRSATPAAAMRSPHPGPSRPAHVPVRSTVLSRKQLRRSKVSRQDASRKKTTSKALCSPCGKGRASVATCYCRIV